MIGNWHVPGIKRQVVLTCWRSRLSMCLELHILRNTYFSQPWSKLSSELRVWRLYAFGKTH